MKNIGSTKHFIFSILIILLLSFVGHQFDTKAVFQPIETFGTIEQTQCGENQTFNSFIGICVCDPGFINENGSCETQLPAVTKTKTFSQQYRALAVEEVVEKKSTEITTGGQTISSTETTVARTQKRKPNKTIFQWTDANRGYMHGTANSCGKNQTYNHENDYCVCEEGFIMEHNVCLSFTESEKRQKETILNLLKRKRSKTKTKRM